MSRIKDAETRRDLSMDDGWRKACTFYDEKKAQQEYSWFIAHNTIREYMLVALLAKKSDDLDDEIPF